MAGEPACDNGDFTAADRAETAGSGHAPSLPARPRQQARPPGGDNEAVTYRYRVLGTTQAFRPDGTEVPVRGTRLRALLAALAAGGGRVVPAGELAAQVWGEDEQRPADESAALQALVGRLRRALGRAAVGSAPGGYRLAADRDDIDLFRFERLAAQGAASLVADDAAASARLLDEGLALWHGPALDDLPGRDTDALVVRAEQRRAEARRTRLAAEVSLGRPQTVLAELTAMAAATPLDEPLQALLIRALRTAGRHAEALQTYEDVRRRLSGRLGTDPGPELRALHAQLLAVGPADDDLPAEPPDPVDKKPVTRGNLRARLTSFVGREEELAGLARELRARRLVTLLGPGGAGKTRLALEAAEAAAGAWPDGVWVVELASVRDEETVPETVLTALGARETQVRGPAAADAEARDPLAQLVEYCGRRRMMLVLDNCEHVIGAAARLADAVLTGCPEVRVLATSREPLGVPGEWVRGVGPLPQEVALRLLGERGAAARPGFRTHDDPEACAEICRGLDGLPLAVELAAARLRALTPRQIADRLDDRFRLLSSGSRTVLPRQQTLRAVVDWSWDLLDEDERTVLRRLAVFSGGCALAQAEAVCGAGALEPLASLVDKSLVVAAPDGLDEMRYRLLETVAEYAGERLEGAGERAAVERRHMRAYRELVRTGDPELRGPRQAEWLERFETEHDNVRAALRTALRPAQREQEQEQEALCLVLSMNWFWQRRNHQADARSWSSVAAGFGPDPFRSPVRPAVPLADRCTAAPPPWSEEQLWEARRGVRLMVFASSQDDGVARGEPQALAHLRRIVSAYRPGLPQICRQPGSMWFFARLMSGEFDGLGEAVDAIVDSCRDLADGWDLGFALLLRATLLGDRRGGLEQSASDADRALALFEAAGDLWGVAESLSARGEAHAGRGRYEEAAADFARAMRSSARVGAHAQVPVFRARLASVRLKTAASPREREHAERQLLEAVEESRESADVLGTGRMMLAQHYGNTGRTELARHQLHEMERDLSAATPELFRGVVAGAYGWLDCLDGEYAAARRRIAEAVGLLDSLAHLVAPYLITDQFLCAAWAMAHLGAAEEAARLLGAYDRSSRQPGGLGFRPFADEKETRQRAESEVRAAAAGERYERAYAEGGGLSVPEAAALI
ncbi:winged helix-turn-helix domain-containing protein [Streptomyces sp. NBC_01142]|uniref:ATP-binding protein n=1 Tax=Streptomyces sp. NBC_01142 TaxID=2975865 RepID=UPI002258EE41|nr:BTAD domain-containing putative transcriptional regulator [Streptomyces sp. NBC_01142]MCX4825367.1 winged helix-turn-helix domain-containing protein [Streptomyces sp. NBC_01142]